MINLEFLISITVFLWEAGFYLTLSGAWFFDSTRLIPSWSYKNSTASGYVSPFQSLYEFLYNKFQAGFKLS
jgi:hypothetical protein